MKKFYIIFILILSCFMMTANVYAMEYNPEETITVTEEEIVDDTEIVDNTVIDETAPEEIEQDTEIIEKLNDINNNLTMILYTSLFMIFVHFSEKWLKILMSIPRK